MVHIGPLRVDIKYLSPLREVKNGGASLMSTLRVITMGRFFVSSAKTPIVNKQLCLQFILEFQPGESAKSPFHTPGR